MQLTTLARVKRLIPVNNNSNVSSFDALLNTLIAGASSRVSTYLARHVEQKERTEYYTADPLCKRFSLRGAPVLADPALTLIYDPLRTFDGAAEQTSTYYVDLEQGVVTFDYPINFTGYKSPGGIQVVYTGGMAATLETLDAAFTPLVSSLSADDVVTGATNGGTGVVKFADSESIELYVRSGTFEAGELISSGTTTGYLGDFTATPFCLAFPEVVTATEMQVAWEFQRREQLGLTSLSSEGYTVSLEKTATLLAGVKEMLDPYRRYGTSW